MTSRISRTPTRRTRSGFALILVLSLLAFLVLLLVALAAFTRVETATAGLSQQQAQARQSARLALDVAIAQLQAYAGPDTRVTARADAWTGAVTDGRRFWTGVWDGTTTTNTPLTWLVSGNETHAEGNPNLEPTDALPATTVALAETQLIVISDANQAIRVPLVNIAVEDLPGFPDGARRTIGRYGYWVADEGIKTPRSVVDRTGDVTYDDVGGTDYSGVPGTTGFQNRFRLRQTFNPVRRIDLAVSSLDNGWTVGGSPTDPIPLAALLHPAWDDIRDAWIHPFNLSHFWGVDADGFSLPNGASVLQLDWNATVSSSARRRQRELFHDLTWQTASVLTNASGGLRLDLDGGGSVNNDIDQYDSFDEFVSLRATPSTAVSPFGSRLTVRAGDDAWLLPLGAGEAGGDVLNVVGPVLTEVMLDFTVNAGPTPTVTLNLQVELWNPWTSELALPTAAPTRELVLRLLGNPSGAPPSPALPSITISDGVNVFTMSLARMLGEADANDTIGFVVTDATGFGVLPPGGLARFTVTRAALPIVDAGNAPIAGAWDPNPALYTVSTNSPDPTYVVSTELRMIPGNPNPPQINEEGLVRHVGLVFDRVASTPLLTPVALRWHYRMKDNSDTIDPDGAGPEPAQPMALGLFFDPRGPRLVQQTSNPVLQPFDIDDSDPASAAGSVAFDTDTTRLLVSGASEQPVLMFDAPRAELLALGQFQHLPARPLTVADDFNTPAYRVGNPSPAGQEVNRVFDRHFSSGIPRNSGAVPPGTTLWGLRQGRSVGFTPLQLVDFAVPPADTDLQSNRLPRFVVVRGGFNINSTSTAAWRSVLGGVLPAVPSNPADPDTGYGYAQNHLHGGVNYNALMARWEYAGGGGLTQATWLRNAYFRFPFGAQDIRGNLGTLFSASGLGSSTAEDRMRASYRVGFRQLTDRQVAFLAERVVERIRTRTRGPAGPFRSLEDFLNEGILQDALADDSGVAGVPNDAFNFDMPRTDLTLNQPDALPRVNDAIPTGPGWIVPRRSPVALTQADIVQQLAPIAFPRSDTFLIRTYGEAVNPALDPADRGYVQGRAWLEAIVQRVPRKNQNSDPVTSDLADDLSPTGNVTGENLGREFRVVSFRWLGRDDI